MPRILLVDDEPFQLKLLARQLVNLGQHSGANCTSGQAALEVLDAQPASKWLIFLDLNMPDMDGVEFIRQLVTRDYRGALVLFSGEDERVLEMAVRLGQAHHLTVLGHLHKPIQPDVLQGLLERWSSQSLEPQRASPRTYSPVAVCHAIANGELVNYYQPKVDVATGALRGVETLVRWQHPDDGLVFPDQFISVAETHGFIDDLTHVVLIEALAQARRWHDSGLALRVAVNVSMKNLVGLDFADFVLDQVLQSGVAAQDLILEVTESRLMTDLRIPLDVLTRLRLKHISLSIDDFGTGHSSLSQLRDIAFNELKIDRGFVHHASQDKTKHAIFTASLNIARQLEMKIVAEGVEDRADWEFLRQQDCDLAQGYFVAKAMPAAELPRWLAEWTGRYAALL
ncbi:EAL domain-containing response regulator [Rhodoferax sp. 4810]|uniref:EAL domain-containing response regulator n=1 Tax=Thiospirillum jenense TaxID=1653858 RepID=A0A839HAK3_9GAMM|nr:EAL domain-containing response regulator [Thiospirillum jenense]MBB1075863.1 EAL domain-containing response regulator [Rhodoferax jenense]MBB1126113.1 EAL domain-containing response regulator [Thiospirillum jenense]